MSADPKSDGPSKDRPRRRSFLLRLPPELHDELRRWAEAEVRSLNGHVEFLLREAVRKRRRANEDSETEPGSDAPTSGSSG